MTRWGVLPVAALLLVLMAAGCGEPDGIPSDPKEAIRTGWMLISVSEFDRAEAAFNQAAAAYRPGTRDFFMARYGLGNAYQHRKPTARYEEAKQVFKEIVEQDKDGELGAWSALAIVRIDHLKLYEPGRLSASGRSVPDPSELAPVRAEYQKIIADFPNTLPADEAAIQYGASLIAQVSDESIQEGIAWLEKWAAAHAQSPELSHAYNEIALGSEMLGDYQKQLEALIASAEHRPDPEADRAAEYFRIAQVAEKRVKDFETARTYYKKFLAGNPNDFRLFWAQRALARLAGKGTH